MKDREGFPRFQHGPWTIEGEIERFGAFASGARRARGAKRWVAIVIVVAFVAPFVLGAFSLAVGLF